MSNTNCNEKATHRDFITLTASSMVVVRAACATYPLVDSIKPSADVYALSSIEVCLSHIQTGQTLTIKLQGKPVFITDRTPE